MCYKYRAGHAKYFMVALFKTDSSSTADFRRFLPIISYLEDSSSLEAVFCQLRKKHGLSQKQVGQIINSCHEVVSNCEAGKRDLRTTEILALANYHPDFGLAAIAFFERRLKAIAG